MTLFRLRHHDGSSSIAARLIGSLGIVLVALLAYLSVDQTAHERIHHHSDNAEHHCVITAYAGGEALVLTPILALRPEGVDLTLICWRAIDCSPVAGDRTLLPSCGPPASGFSV